MRHSGETRNAHTILIGKSDRKKPSCTRQSTLTAVTLDFLSIYKFRVVRHTTLLLTAEILSDSQ
jgi:hypothetical protein